MERHSAPHDWPTKDLIVALARRLLSWTTWKLVSALVFLTLAAGWYAVLLVVFIFSGLRTLFYGADDLWIAALNVALVLLLIPVFIAHERIMRKIRTRGVRSRTLTRCWSKRFQALAELRRDHE